MSAQILPFTPRHRAGPRREAAADAVPAIVIFPGVRYERLADDEAQPSGDLTAAAQRH
jgi:hypothetical protein